ncbi:hypothetical protein HK096_011324 [Nowakowskiella sp. JEL0078]|nr:hypothetical protein HK096_011324 [Nowakowskiella sp. JEL0078]
MDSNGAEYNIKIDVPGIKKSDVDVEVNEDRRWLRVSGESSNRVVDLKIPLPRNADLEKVEGAGLEDGVLMLTIQKNNDGEKNIEIS